MGSYPSIQRGLSSYPCEPLLDKKQFTSGIDIGRADCIYKSLGLFEDDDFDNKKETKDCLIVIVWSGHVMVFKNR